MNLEANRKQALKCNFWKCFSISLLLFIVFIMCGICREINSTQRMYHYLKWTSSNDAHIIVNENSLRNETYENRTPPEGHILKDVQGLLTSWRYARLTPKLTSTNDAAGVPWCSLDSFRQYFKTHHKFPEQGSWVNEHEGFGYTERYELEFCAWKPVNVPECLQRKEVRRIFMTGDSTGFRLFLSMLNMTIQAGGQCNLRDYEHGPIDLNGNATYYAGRLGDHRIGDAFLLYPRGCKWCKAQVYSCMLTTHTGIKEIELDFIETFLFNDDSLRISKVAADKYNLTISNNMQEFFFKNYFVKHGTPDLMIMSMPLNHEKWRPRQDTVKRFQDMMKFISAAKSAEMPLMFIPTASEFDSKRLTLSYNQKTFNGFLAGDFIYKLNKELYPKLEPYLLKPELNIHSFVNLVNMSSSKRDWNEDGVHYNYIWYNNVIRNICSLFCA